MQWNRALPFREPTGGRGACPSFPRRWKDLCPMHQRRPPQSHSWVSPLEARFGMGEQTANIFVVPNNDQKGSGRDEGKHLRSITIWLENPGQDREHSHGKDRGERNITER